MKSFFARFAAMCLVGAACCGCRSHVEVDGKSYAALTDDEMRELVVMARATMAKNSPSHASKAEVAEMRRIEPDIKIRYYGNCIGEAVVSWELEDRRIEIVYDGVLNSTDPSERDIFLRVMKKQPPMLDFRPGRQQAPPPRKP